MVGHFLLFRLERLLAIYLFSFLFGQRQILENKEFQDKVNLLQQQLASVTGDKSTFSSEQCISEEYVDELRKKVQSQVITMIFFAFLNRSNFVKSWLSPSLLWVVFHFLHF